MKTRIIRINDQIAEVAADIIRSELSDPRLGAVITVLRAETTADLKQSKIWVSVPGEETDRQKTMDALTGATGFIRRRIAEVINLRQTPEIKFIYDDSIEHGMRMRKLIEDVNKTHGREDSDD